MQEQFSRIRLHPICSLALLVCALAAGPSGCGLGTPYGFNYLDPRSPRYARACRGAECGSHANPEDRSFRLVSFNIKFSEHLARAVETLRAERWANADVLLLQEMDWRGSEFVGRCLGYDVVYYPAALHPKPRHDFGVALLARWPIRDDRKILLPSLSHSDAAGKISLAATVWVKGVPVRFVSTHIQSGLTAVQVADQAQVVALCAVEGVCPPGTPSWPPTRYPVVMAGDFNTPDKSHVRAVTDALSQFGLQRVPGIEGTFPLLGPLLGRTATLDHVFVSTELIRNSRGSVASRHDGSDHFPVMAEIALPGPATSFPALSGTLEETGGDPEKPIPCTAAGAR